jgi:serine protease DegQ
MLGITLDLTPTQIRDMKLKAFQSGPVIEKVELGSAAERAELQVGDVVTAIDGVSVRDSDQFRGRMGLDWIADSIELMVLRAGQSIVIRAAKA